MKTPKSKHKKPKLVRTVPYAYFVTHPEETVAYRAKFTIDEKQRPLGLYTITGEPEVFLGDGWERSVRYMEGATHEEDEGGVSSFTAAIQTGVVKRVSMITACAKAGGDIRLFAPTQSSRINSQKTV